MELLLSVALNLAHELKHQTPSILDELESQPQACLTLIKELQCRIEGYELSDYVKAMSHAIKVSTFITRQ